MIADSTGNESNICQIYAIKNGSVVFNDCWRGYKTTDAVNVMSVTKSVMALLIGIAIDRGYIRSVNQKVIDFFPDYSVKRGEKTIYKVTLRHLLTMTAPYKYRRTGQKPRLICSAAETGSRVSSNTLRSVYKSYRA